VNVSETPQQVLEQYVEATRAVLLDLSVTICRRERAKGNGSCGACSLCCEEQREAAAIEADRVANWMRKVLDLEERAKCVEMVLRAVWTFPGVRDLFAPEDSLGSVAAQVRAALRDTEPGRKP